MSELDPDVFNNNLEFDELITVSFSLGVPPMPTLPSPVILNKSVPPRSSINSTLSELVYPALTLNPKLDPEISDPVKRPAYLASVATD